MMCMSYYPNPCSGAEGIHPLATCIMENYAISNRPSIINRVHVHTYEYKISRISHLSPSFISVMNDNAVTTTIANITSYCPTFTL